jgi:hypothetical protein
MHGQEFYGRMRRLPPAQRGGPVSIPCNKCKGLFNLEKKHTEVYLLENYFGRTKEGTLTPATPKEQGFYQLCPGCKLKLDEWLKG